MAVNLRKFMQLIVFFAHQEAVKPLGKTKLFKLLYFTDVAHFRTTGHLLTDAEYLKAPYGPIPTQGDFALKELRKRQLIHQGKTTLPNGRFRRDITALASPDMTIFAEQEMQTINSVIQQYGENSAAVLSSKSHKELAWLSAEDWQPLQFTAENHKTESTDKNAAAIAWVEQWYSTPDEQPPGYWDEFEELLKVHPIDFGDKDLAL